MQKMKEMAKNRSWTTVLLCLIVAGMFLFVAGCDDDDDDDDITGGDADTLSFQSIDVPVTDEEKRRVKASPSVEINGESYDIGYHTMMRSGDSINGTTFGLIRDQSGVPVVERDGSLFISSDNDFSSLIQAGDKLYNITHFESRPGAMYISELSQDPATGMLTPVNTRNIDFSAWEGLWVPCAGSVTPWGTHLGSEEYPPDARVHEEAQSMEDIEDYDKPMLRYFGVADPFAENVTVADFRSLFNAYRYGYPVEVAVNEDGSYNINKWYAMGRVALELAYVMPDEKTVYLSDDGTNVGLFMFVADTPGDLSAGALYAAQWNQIDSVNGGFADIQWIELGHADQAEIQTAVESRLQFSDIFDAAAPNDDDTCPAGFSSINTEDSGHECLRVKSGMEKIASRLETRRYAAMLGATTELRKEEGITFDPDNKVLYVAMSEVSRGMEDYMRNGESNDRYDVGGPNHITLPYNLCGCVYGMDIGTDSDIGSNYVALNMYGVVCGTMAEYAGTSPYANNTCDVNGIANPDNLTFIRGYKTLIIGEDTGSGHQNDAIWSFDIESEELTRIETTPYGSETTSPYYYPDINNWAYIMSVVQHPYGESDEDKLADPSQAAAYVGFIGPMPAME